MDLIAFRAASSGKRATSLFKESTQRLEIAFPGSSRAGVDLKIWDLVALKCLQNGAPLAAAAILVQGDGYLRLCEIMSLRRGSVIPPAASGRKKDLGSPGGPVRTRSRHQGF